MVVVCSFFSFLCLFCVWFCTLVYKNKTFVVFFIILTVLLFHFYLYFLFSFWVCLPRLWFLLFIYVVVCMCMCEIAHSFSFSRAFSLFLSRLLTRLFCLFVFCLYSCLWEPHTCLYDHKCTIALCLCEFFCFVLFRRGLPIIDYKESFVLYKCGFAIKFI